MELYSRAISPFAARVRVSILAKELPVRVIEGPDVHSEAYARIHPWRRVPVLVLDDGTTLPESEVIVEYLEDRYPQVPLRPTDPAERARVRLIARAAELYLFPSVVDIFQARGLGPSDPQHIEKLFSALELNLLRLSGLLDDRSDSWHALGARLSLADGALAPFLQYVDVIAKASGRKLLEPHPRLERFWSGAQRDPLVSTVTQEIARALAR